MILALKKVPRVKSKQIEGLVSNKTITTSNVICNFYYLYFYDFMMFHSNSKNSNSVNSISWKKLNKTTTQKVIYTWINLKKSI